MKPFSFGRAQVGSSLALLVSLGLASGCDDDASSGESSSMPSTGDASVGGGARTFEVSIENVSGDAPIATPISPGVFATHDASFTLFTAGMADRGDGLVGIAEDGDPMQLANTLATNSKLTSEGVFDTPFGESTKGPAIPGKRFSFVVSATPASPNLSFVTMFGQSNDLFFSPDAAGIPLFDDGGRALAERDVTALVYLWDVGSELNQMPGMGPVQAPRQSAPNVGSSEGVVAPFADSTRSLPSARRIAALDVSVTSDGTFTVKVVNVSGPGSSIVTGISPVFYAVHDASWQLFTEGEPAASGLEGLAEDGNAPGLAAAHEGAAGTIAVGAAAVPEGATTAGPAGPGASYTFQVRPDAAHRFLSIATMVGESNDAFLSFGSKGVALLDEAGTPRPVAELVDDFSRALAVWDAGTEANEVPGVGMNQAPRQVAPNTGPADPKGGVRRYADPTNDLASGAGGVVRVEIASGPDSGHRTVTITNTSGATAFPGRASPAVWVVHNGEHAFIRPNEAAPESVERLAEDGKAMAWDASLEGNAAISAHGIASTPTAGASPGPIAPGAMYTFVIPIGGDCRYFDFAQMWTPSNDTFLTLGPKGVALLDDSGTPRSIADINADLETQLSAWDAGTEANQAAALGPDQAPRQAAANTGASEGGGTVRRADPTWGLPPVNHLLRIRIKPL